MPLTSLNAFSECSCWYGPAVRIGSGTLLGLTSVSGCPGTALDDPHAKDHLAGDVVAHGTFPRASRRKRRELNRFAGLRTRSRRLRAPNSMILRRHPPGQELVDGS
jgi:hypothetical protein